MTTNLPLRAVDEEVLGSERLTGAVLDRLTHRCHILESNGESYRLKDARRRVGSKKSRRQNTGRERIGLLGKARGECCGKP